MLELNKVMLIGNLTQDPEIRNTASGSQVASIRIAVNESWKDSQGQKKQKTCFIDCEAWNKQAAFAGQYLRKGTRVFIEGSLDLDEWQDQQTGQKRSKHKIKVLRVTFAEPPQNGDGNGNGNGGGYQQPQGAQWQQQQAPPAQGYQQPAPVPAPAPQYQAPPQQQPPQFPQQPATAGAAPSGPDQFAF